MATMVRKQRATPNKLGVGKNKAKKTKKQAIFTMSHKG
jgi:hypothetical protein